MERSQEKELIDLGPQYYTSDEYQDCMKKLFLVNRLMGFFRDTVQLLKKFSAQSSVLDVGCGDGLFLLHLSRYHPNMSLLGIDINAQAIDLAQQKLQTWKHNNCRRSVHFQLQNELVLSDNSFDIVLATLVCHHISDSNLIDFLGQLYAVSRKAVILNDLHRSKLAYNLYRIISPILFRNRLITHDGLISIRRGFVYTDWKLLLQKANIQHYQIQWRFPFRWRIILWKK